MLLKMSVFEPYVVYHHVRLTCPDTNPGVTSCRCLPKKLLGLSLRLPNMTVLLCSLLLRSNHADVMSLFSRCSAANSAEGTLPVAVAVAPEPICFLSVAISVARSSAS